MTDIYFDNSATTKIDDKVFEYMKDFNDKYYANPAAAHHFGYLVENEVKNNTSYIAKCIGADSDEMIWTSGGTESNNLAIFGYVYSHKKVGNHLIVSSIEHPSVLNVYKKLEEEGFTVSHLSVDSTGHIDMDELEKLISDKTLMVSIMAVNNEIGSLQDISKISDIIKSKNKNVAFHTDFVQAFGKVKVDCKKQNIDFLSISSHKFHGPKGVGILYKNKNLRINPLLLGGGQQKNLRSGTLNTLGIAGTSFAAKMIYDDFDGYVMKLKSLKSYLIEELDKLDAKHKNIFINTKDDDTFAPHIVSISFLGIRAEVLLHALEEYNIYVSAGSACSSHDKKLSSTLTSVNLDKNLLDSTIRVSFGKYNTKEEIDTFISTLDKLIPMLNIKKLKK